MRIKPLRDRRAPYRFRLTGTVFRPAGTPATACANGLVSAQVKVGRKTISTRRTKLTSRCTYGISLRFAKSRRLGNGRLKVTVRFLGSQGLSPKRVAPRRLRAG